MAIYRGKYILQGLNEITADMEHNLDIAYEICMSYRDIPCEMCGKCCHQPNIIVLPEEIERVSAAAGIPSDIFETDASLSQKKKEARARFWEKTADAQYGRTVRRYATISRTWCPCS